MKKIIISAALLFLTVGILTLICYKKYDKKIKIQDEIEVYKDITLKELIDDNIELLENYKINTENIGEQEIIIKYKNKMFKYKRNVKIKISDTQSPVLETKNVSVEKETKIDITNDFSCTDNYDKEPNCYIEGTYDLNETGNYNLKYIGEDSSNNKAEQDFILTVYEKPQEKNIETLVCTKVQNISGTKTASSAITYFENSKLSNINLLQNIEFSEENQEYKQLFINNYKKVSADDEEKYGIKSTIIETQKGMKMSINASKQQFEESSGMILTTKKEVIEEFEKEGFECK